MTTRVSDADRARRGHRLILAGLAAAVIALPAAASGAPLKPGMPVERIDVKGCKTVDPTVVEGQIRVRVGDPYNQDRATEDVARILALGLFANVTLDAATGEKGVILTYTVFEKRRVDQIVFRGNDSVGRGKLLSLTGLSGKVFVDDFRLVQACRDIEAHYKEQGYAFAKVTSAVETIEGTPAAVITVREGPHVRVQAVVFRGVTAVDPAVLRRLIQTKPAFKVLPIFRPGRFNEETVNQDVNLVRDYYVKEGYLDVAVSYQLDFNADRTRVTVVILVKEGRPFTVGTIEVRGASVFSAAEITEQMALRAGGSFTGRAMAADRAAVEALYGRIGYITTTVVIDRRFATAPNVVNIVVQVTEGGQIRLGAVRVEGNDKTRRHVILRELRVEPGEVLNADQLEVSRRRLARLRFFKSVSLDRLEGPLPDEKDLVVEVVEDRTANIILGAAVGTETGLVGSVSYVQNNFDIARWPRSIDDILDGRAFAGAGQRFRLEARPGTELQQFLVEFKEPYLFGSEYSFGVRAFLYDRERDDYDEGRDGVNLTLGRRFSDAITAEVLVRFESVDITDIDADAPVDIFDVAGDNSVTGLRLTVSHDTRDDWIDPTTGHRYQASIEQVGALGGDFDFTRLMLRAGWYTPVYQHSETASPHILSLGGRMGFIFSDAPIFERFYAGGTYTMRGFDYRGLGPHEAGNPIGGEFMAVGTAEYSFPLVERTLRGVVFLDVGTVEEDIAFGTIRASIGFGLRLYLGQLGPAPMQFNFGFPISEDDEDETQVFSFAVGTRL